MQRKLHVLAAAVFFALLLGVGAALGSDAGYGTTIPVAALKTKVGGACANTKCVAETCVTNQQGTACDIQTPTCTKVRNAAGQFFCHSIRISPGEKCNDPPGNDQDWNCSQTTGANPCAEYWDGTLDQQGGCVGPPQRCAAIGAYCGTNRHTCTQTACVSGQ